MRNLTLSCLSISIHLNCFPAVFEVLSLAVGSVNDHHNDESLKQSELAGVLKVPPGPKVDSGGLGGRRDQIKSLAPWERVKGAVSSLALEAPCSMGHSPALFPSFPPASPP